MMLPTVCRKAGLMGPGAVVRLRIMICAAVLATSATGCGLLRRDPVHRQWQDREVLPACGDVTLTGTGDLERAAEPGLDCLREGMRTGEGGELIVHFMTVEGDPITDYRRVTTQGTTEIYTDSTQDEFGSKKWSYGNCHEPKSVLDVVC